MNLYISTFAATISAYWSMLMCSCLWMYICKIIQYTGIVFCIIELDLRFRLIPSFIWHMIGLILLIPASLLFKIRNIMYGDDTYAKFTKLGSKIVVKGTENIPNDKPIFFYQTHVTWHGFDLLPAHVYNQMCNKNAKYIGINSINHPLILPVIHYNLINIYRPPHLIDNARDIIKQHLQQEGAIFIIPTGIDINTVGDYKDRHYLYNARYDDSTFKFKPGFLELSENAILIPIHVEIDFPIWVKWMGRLHQTVFLALHAIFAEFIYSNRTLYITYSKPLDKAMTDRDRLTIIAIRADIKQMQAALRDNVIDANVAKEYADNIRGKKQEMQIILDKYDDAMYGR